MEGMFKPPVTLLWRTLQIPNEAKILGVENDMNSEYVEFILPKRYQVFDLSANDKVILIDTMNQQNEIFDTSEPIKEVIGNDMHLYWTVGKIPPNINGEVYLRIRILGLATNEFIWQTETATFNFLPTFKTADPPDPWEMTWFDQLIVQITRLRNETQEFRDEAHILRDQTEVLRNETQTIREETRDLRNEAEGFSQDAYNSADEADRFAKLAQLAYERAPFIHPMTATWYEWSYDAEEMVDTGIDAYGTRWFTMTESLPGNVAPEGARLDDIVMNTGIMPIQIGNLLEQPVGAVCKVIQVDPFLVVPVGNIRGPRGPGGDGGTGEFDLVDDPADDKPNLPETGSKEGNFLMQMVRNLLKWLTYRFDSIGNLVIENTSTDEDVGDRTAGSITFQTRDVNGGPPLISNVIQTSYTPGRNPEDPPTQGGLEFYMNQEVNRSLPPAPTYVLPVPDSSNQQFTILTTNAVRHGMRPVFFGEDQEFEQIAPGESVVIPLSDPPATTLYTPMFANVLSSEHASILMVNIVREVNGECNLIVRNVSSDVTIGETQLEIVRIGYMILISL